MSQAVTEVDSTLEMETERAEPESTEPDPEALSAAVDGVRRLIANLRKTKAPGELLERVANRVRELSDELDEHDHPGPYAQRRLVLRMENMPPGAAETPAEFFPYSPVIGPLNAIAPPVEFRLEGREMHAEHVFDAPYNGPPTAVHGGVIALVFDELLGTTGAMLDTGGFTGTLSIRYESLTPLGRPIRMRGWIDRREGRKIFIRGTMHDGDRLCAQAEGVFIQPRESMMADVLAQRAKRESHDSPG